MECNNQESNFKCHEENPIDYLEAHITIFAHNGIREEIARKVTDSWTKGTKLNYQWMFEQWCSFCHKRGLPVLTICVNNWIPWLLQVIHDYAHTTLCIHASAICSILQPTEQKKASTALGSNSSLRRCSERSHQPESGWYLECEVGPSPTACLEKAFSLELHSSNFEDIHDLGLSYSQEVIRSESIKDYSRGYADNRGLSYLPTSVWANNARPNHPYGPTITLRWEEDECLCPVRLIKEYIAKAKDRKDKSEKLFVMRKMGPAVAISSGTIAIWLKDTLILANMRASGGSTRKAAATCEDSQGASLRTIMETCDWAHTSIMYGHYIRCLPKKVLVRIPEKHQIAFKELMRQRNLHTTHTDKECYAGETWASITSHLLDWIEKLQSVPKCAFLTFCRKFYHLVS